ncbi:MAG: hypothetical protein MRERC_2c139 [Mycoplasmataceae bacterium RC_NB112A]|nr:MAG: hypothetical protein MRERC_2c139 [Mycoplasmataceae bacterium RC_NB112A]
MKKEIENKSINNDSLLLELKTNHGLSSSETEWEKYLENTSNTTELEEKKKNVLTIIKRLTGNPTQGPGSQPGPAPINQWENILWEIKVFLDKNPSKSEIENWVKNKKGKINDPLDGINLKGADKNELLKLNRGRRK